MQNWLITRHIGLFPGATILLWRSQRSRSVMVSSLDVNGNEFCIRLVPKYTAQLHHNFHQLKYYLFKQISV